MFRVLLMTKAMQSVTTIYICEPAVMAWTLSPGLIVQAFAVV